MLYVKLVLCSALNQIKALISEQLVENISINSPSNPISNNKGIS